MYALNPIIASYCQSRILIFIAEFYLYSCVSAIIYDHPPHIIYYLIIHANLPTNRQLKNKAKNITDNRTLHIRP